jgi:hypothetical protein
MYAVVARKPTDVTSFAGSFTSPLRRRAPFKFWGLGFCASWALLGLLLGGSRVCVGLVDLGIGTAAAVGRCRWGEAGRGHLQLDRSIDPIDAPKDWCLLLD